MKPVDGIFKREDIYNLIYVTSVESVTSLLKENYTVYYGSIEYEIESLVLRTHSPEVKNCVHVVIKTPQGLQEKILGELVFCPKE